MCTISVVIVTKNEQTNIANCLDNLKWADEIVIIDDVSTDKTIEICRRYTKNVYINDSQGSFHENKNMGLEKARGEWILSLDADEIVKPELAREIKEAINHSNKIGYYIPRKNYFLGTWINGCGWWPDRIIRLFKKGVTRWPLEIHDTPKIRQKNKVGELQNALIHHTYRNLKNYFEKFNQYTTRLANEEYEKGVRINFKNIFLFFLIKPLYWFICKYFFYKGFRNAYPGFFISFSSSLVIIATYSKLWELQKN